MARDERVETLVDKTASAYSFDAYGEKGWRSCIKMLIKRGLTDRQIEAVLRSKWTRWAGDRASDIGKRYGRFNGNHRFVIILSRDADGPVYLGRLDLGRQGVRRVENAIHYKTRVRAELVARDYATATVTAKGQ